MLKKLALFGAFFVCCGIALASNPARFDLPVVTTTPAQVPPGALPNLLAVTNATVSICGYPATVVNGMCTNTITTYTDSTLSTACPSTAQMTAPGTSVCISTTGLQGTFGFWYNAATQTHMTYTLQTSWGTYGPYDIDPGAAGSGNGTVTTYSAGNAAPLFNTSVANPTTTPALSFSLNAFAAHSFYGNNGASTATPAVSLLGVSDWSPNAFALGAGTAQAQTATLNPPATALTAGLEVRWLPVAANTAAGPTLNVNGLGARVITKVGTSALAANDLTTMAVADVIFDGTYFQLQDPQTNAAGASGAVLLSPPAANQTINYNTSGATTLTVTNPNAGSGATSGYTASNGADFFSLELAGSGTALPGAASFISSNATAPLSFETGGGPILFNAPNTNVSGALNYASDTGSANAYVVAPPSCVSATHAGTTINFKAANASTGASTLVYCSGSPVTLEKNVSTALTTGDILAGGQYSARYEPAGPDWQLLNSSLTGGGSSLPSGTGLVAVNSGTGALSAPWQVLAGLTPQVLAQNFSGNKSGSNPASNFAADNGQADRHFFDLRNSSDWDAEGGLTPVFSFGQWHSSGAGASKMVRSLILGYAQATYTVQGYLFYSSSGTVNFIGVTPAADPAGTVASSACVVGFDAGAFIFYNPDTSTFTTLITSAGLTANSWYFVTLAAMGNSAGLTATGIVSITPLGSTEASTFLVGAVPATHNIQVESDTTADAQFGLRYASGTNATPSTTTTPSGTVYTQIDVPVSNLAYASAWPVQTTVSSNPAGTQVNTYAILPPSYRVGSQTPWVLYLHGDGQYGSAIFAGNDNTLINALAYAGYAVVSTDYTSITCWGNQACTQDVASVIANYQAFFDLAPHPYVIVESMGGLVGLNSVFHGMLTPRAIVGLYPVYSLANIWDAGAGSFTSQIQTAYSFTGNANYPAATAGYDPGLDPISSFVNIPMDIWCSTSDTTVNCASNGEALVNAVNAAGGSATWNASSGTHGDASNFNPAAVVNFFNAH